MGETIIFPRARFLIDEDQIIHCNFENPDSNYKLQAPRVLEYIDAIIKLTNGLPLPFLIDLSKAKGTFELEAAKLFATHPEFIKLKLAEGYVAKSIGMRLLILSYKRIYDPITPYKIFGSTTSALKYCLEFKKTANANN